MQFVVEYVFEMEIIIRIQDVNWDYPGQTGMYGDTAYRKKEKLILHSYVN